LFLTAFTKMGTIRVMKKKQKTDRSLIYEITYHGESPRVISDFLKQSSPLSGRSLRQYFFKGLVELNRKKAHSQAKIKDGDIIRVYGIHEEQPTLNPEMMPLDIIFENDDLLVINKPAQIAVHPSGNIASGTLANGIAAYFEKNGLKIKVRPVNRLDYGTSGLILFAKKPEIQTVLTRATQENQIHRIYYAVVKGVPDDQTGSINLPIKEVKGRRIVSVHGQSAETDYRVIEELNNTSLLELSLKSGRTHQIRVHLSHIGHPILGDPQYGIPSPFIKRPALHAGKLDFSATGLPIQELSAPFPEDFNNLLTNLRKSSV
jgi:23S rRNA pseudouridine1911/1915/1917 synthase